MNEIAPNIGRRLFTPGDLLTIPMADDPQISPDGMQVAWVHTRIDAQANRYRSQIVVTDVTSGVTRALSHGRGLDTHPRWSPAGEWLAYLTTDPSAGSVAPPADEPLVEMPPQLCIVATADGMGRVVTNLAWGAGSAVWSPDGRQLAFDVWVAPDRELAACDQAQPLDEQLAELYTRYTADVMVIRRRKWKMDGLGFLGERVRAIALIDGMQADAQNVRLIACGKGDLHSPVWSPDGKRMALVGNIEHDADGVRRQHIYLLAMPAEALAGPEHEPAAGSSPSLRSLAALADIRHPGLAWSPDGRTIAVAGHNNGLIGHYGNQQFCLVDATSGEMRVGGAALDFCLGNAAYTDVGRYEGESGLRWCGDQPAVLALVSAGGTVHLNRIDIHGVTFTPLTHGSMTVTAFSVDRTGRRAAILARTPQNPGEIVVLELDQGADRQAAAPSAPRALARLHERMRIDFALSPPQHFTVAHAGVKLDAWLIRPTHHTPGVKAPAILYCGGGPGGMRAPNFMFEYQFLAAAGYAVVYCNARGCQGYGEAFCTAILGRWGKEDFDDCMATVDAAIATFPDLDPERWAIVGGSYGGYLVNWAIGHTNRFRAAIADRSVVNRYSAYGTSDIGHLREFEYGDTPPWEESAAYLRQSPLAYLQQVQTPTLVIHAANDLRCHIEQGEQLFSALKRLGVPVEFVRFHNEGHELSRSGRPWHRIFRLERYLAWLQRWL